MVIRRGRKGPLDFGRLVLIGREIHGACYGKTILAQLNKLCPIDNCGGGWRRLSRCPRVVLAHDLVYTGYCLLFLLVFDFVPKQYTIQ